MMESISSSSASALESLDGGSASTSRASSPATVASTQATIADTNATTAAGSGTAAAGTVAATGTLGGGASIASVSPAANPQAAIKFDIRAHSAAAKSRLQDAMSLQSQSSLAKQQAANQIDEAPSFSWMCKVIPFYNFTQRKKLYKAAAEAEVKFNLYTADRHFDQVKIDYLEALSKSSLKPEEQHAKYTQFKQAVQKADDLNYEASRFEQFFVAASSAAQKRQAETLKTKKTAAAQAEQQVQQLLKEMQQPHTELRHNVAQVLQYREAQWHRTPDKPSAEAQTLKQEMKVIVDFQRGGGLASLSATEATALNKLLAEASTKYKAFKDESDPTKRDSLQKDFKIADKALMDEIRRLGGQLKGPPELRKELNDHLKHKEAVKAAAGTTAVPADLEEEITTLKAFLDSEQLAFIKPEQTRELMDLFKVANSKYLEWTKLEVTAKDLQTEADKAATDTPPKTLSKEKTEFLDKARQAANDAKLALKEADADVMKEIKLLGPPITLYAKSNDSVFSSTPPLPSSFVPQPPTPTRVPAILPSDFMSKHPLPDDEDLDLSSSPSVGSPATPSTTTPLDRLWAVAERLQNSRVPEKGKPLSELLKKQLASLQKFLDLDAAALGELPAEKTAPLIKLMREIEGKNKLSATVSRTNESSLQADIADLENQFIAGLASTVM